MLVRLSVITVVLMSGCGLSASPEHIHRAEAICSLYGGLAEITDAETDLERDSSRHLVAFTCLDGQRIESTWTSR